MASLLSEVAYLNRQLQRNKQSPTYPLSGPVILVSYNSERMTPVGCKPSSQMGGGGGESDGGKCFPQPDGDQTTTITFFKSMTIPPADAIWLVLVQK